MLKPYLASGEIRFIGATTYEEYKNILKRAKAWSAASRTWIKEPSEEDTVKILEGLKNIMKYTTELNTARVSWNMRLNKHARYINERCLPDKAIDLIDEAGAYRKLHPQDQKTQTVGKGLIDDILSKTCQIPKQVVESDGEKAGDSGQAHRHPRRPGRGGRPGGECG